MPSLALKSLGHSDIIVLKNDLNKGPFHWSAWFSVPSILNWIASALSSCFEFIHSSMTSEPRRLQQRA